MEIILDFTLPSNVKIHPKVCNPLLSPNACKIPSNYDPKVPIKIRCGHSNIPYLFPNSLKVVKIQPSLQILVADATFDSPQIELVIVIIISIDALFSALPSQNYSLRKFTGCLSLFFPFISLFFIPKLTTKYFEQIAMDGNLHKFSSKLIK